MTSHSTVRQATGCRREMKKIEAIIRSEKLGEVKSTLERAGVIGMNMVEVQGRGRQKGLVRMWRGVAQGVDLLPKMKVEVVVNDEEVEMVVQAILKAAWTGNIGDGKIFVLPVEEVIRVRTGERGKDAI